MYTAMDKIYYVYILSSKPNGTLYIGVTSNLAKRVYQHKNKTIPNPLENVVKVSEKWTV